MQCSVKAFWYKIARTGRSTYQLQSPDLQLYFCKMNYKHLSVTGWNRAFGHSLSSFYLETLLPTHFANWIRFLTQNTKLLISS